MYETQTTLNTKNRIHHCHVINLITVSSEITYALLSFLWHDKSPYCAHKKAAFCHATVVFVSFRIIPNKGSEES